ncbi:MAG: ComEC/Rec2 family competence protein [Rhodocyclaceae bacterium]|nr:ComEC/Rec2 family competence protein [Rhodocyclaceae bacterium]
MSGLHVTMVAGLAGWLANRGWRRSSWLMLQLPAQKVAAAVGFLAALIYCLCWPALPCRHSGRSICWRWWRWRCETQPHGGHQPSAGAGPAAGGAGRSLGGAGRRHLQLSFGAVGLLFYVGAGRLSESHWLATWGRAQWAVTIGMMPALLPCSSQFSLVSPPTLSPSPS